MRFQCRLYFDPHGRRRAHVRVPYFQFALLIIRVSRIPEHDARGCDEDKSCGRLRKGRVLSLQKARRIAGKRASGHRTDNLDETAVHARQAHTMLASVQRSLAF